MSKGEIVSHIGDGQYRIRQKLAVDRIQQELQSLNERIAELAVKIPETKLELIQAEDAVKDKIRDIDLAIPALQNEEEGAREQIKGLQIELVKLQSEVKQIDLRLSNLIAENLSALKRRGQLEAIPEFRELRAWCADYTTDLAGEVGLVDVNDEGGQGTLIQPGFQDGAAYSAEGDGALFPNLGQTAAQIYFNAAVMPGVQKWFPRYRIGTISNIRNDVCDVMLDDARSSAQNLPINKASSLSDVPILYMDCNGAAFADGDKVLVRFTNNGPLVVGFEKEPVPCRIEGIVCVPSKAEVDSVSVEWGKPFQDAQTGVEINPPLGTEGGDDPAWILSPWTNSWRYKRGQPETYGMRDWVGPDEKNDVLTWSGPESRVSALYRRPVNDAVSATFSRFVFHKGQVLVDLPYGVTTLQRVTIEGAAITHKPSGRFIRVCHSNAQLMHRTRNTSSPEQLELKILEWYWPEGGTPVYVGEVDSFIANHEYPPCSGAYFSEDGDRMVLTCAQDVLGDIYVYRWTESGGFSEAHEDTQLTYQNTRTSSWTGSGDGGFTQTVTNVGSSPSLDVALYYDYRGSEEVRVSIGLSQRNHNDFRTSTETGDVVSDKTSNSYESDMQGPTTIKAGSTTIYQSPDVMSHTSTFSGSFTAGSASEGTQNATYTTSEMAKSYADIYTDAMLIDGRHGLVLIHAFISEASQTVERVPYQNSSYPILNCMVTRTRSELNERVISLWHKGRKLKEARVTLIDETSTTTQPERFNLGGPSKDDSVSVSDFTFKGSKLHPELRSGNSAWGSNRFLAGSMASANGKVFASYVAFDTDGNVPLHYASGLSNPVQSLMQRSEDDGYLFYRISRS